MPEGSALDLTRLDILINDLDDGEKILNIKFADVLKTRRTANALETDLEFKQSLRNENVE